MSDKEASAGERIVSIHAVIDRIEDNDMAVVLLGDEEKDQIDLPVTYLPANASDGDHLRITITLDDKSRESMQERIRKLQEELLNRSKK
jgi:DUF3006 family protein